MANLIDAYAPDKKVGNKDPNDWKTAIAGMRRFAAELEAAAKARDPIRVNAAAQRLTMSCSECHGIFRD
jgi:cytochrome c556